MSPDPLINALSDGLVELFLATLRHANSAAVKPVASPPPLYTPLYDKKSYPGLGLPSYSGVDRKPTELEADFHTLADVAKKHERNNPGDIHDRLVESLKQVNAEETLKNLTNHILELKVSFGKISVALGQVDDKNYRKKSDSSTNEERIEKFRPTWDKIHKDFDSLIWASQDVAMDAATHAKVFHDILLPILKDNTLPLSRKKEELRSYILNLEKSEAVAEKMTNSFTALPHRIRAVKIRVGVALKAVGEHQDTRIRDLNKEIDELELRIRKYSNLGRTAMWVGAGGAAAMGVGVLLSLTGVLAPFAIFSFWAGKTAMKGAVIGKAATSGLEYAAEKERDRKIYERDQLIKARTNLDLNGIQAQVDQAFAESEGLCSRLNAIGTVWGVIRTESQLILDSMIKAGNAKTRWSFEPLTEKVCGNAYAQLGEVLVSYSQSITLLSQLCPTIGP
ncbi:hypothetical protein CPB83DRAFT_858163 [Crepidotus variabilis]|uniref:Uncharacterized protein n=1 Tax=Crepidotus variabilis TaxID=179855 RepID=A0A9P6JMZ6_9AGAR|nr:hypothetical protein CPB83DRAFT_858163 [Crepidotus variabilis]